MHFHHIPDTTDLIQQKEVEHFIQTLATHLPASKERLEVYCQAQLTDPTCTAVRTYCITGWPSKQQLTDNLLPYWKVRGELSLYENLLLYGSRIFVPTNLQNETLHKIHQGHQGIQRCLLRIASKAIESYVKNCPQCLKSYTPPKEPLLRSPLPNRPWQKVAADLFELNKSHYLLVIDYFPGFLKSSNLAAPHHLA